MPDDDTRDLRQSVREGTLRRMRQALAETEARRDALVRSIGEVAGSVEECPGAVAARHPVEDGPGSGERIELTVRLLVGLEQSTVLVVDPLTGRALEREVVPHGREADIAAAAVEAAIRARLPSAPGGVPGGLREAPGELRE